MLKTKLSSLFQISILVSTLIVSLKSSAAQPLEVAKAQILVPIKGAPATAGYGVFKNRSQEKIVITGVRSKSFKASELHESFNKNSQSYMRKMKEIEIAPGDSVAFEPGGKHLMLFHPQEPLETGSEITLTFSFKSGESQKISFTTSDR